MKKLFLLCALVVFGMTSAYAQIQEGNIMIGAGLGNSIVGNNNSSILGFNFGLNDGAGYSLGISPKVGYFVKDNLLIGGLVNLGYTKGAETTDAEAPETFTYGLQALSRYYLSPGEEGVDNLLNHGRFFLEVNAGIAGENIKDGNTTNGFIFGFGPGYSYFVSDNVALETSLKYNGLVGGGNTTYKQSIGLNFGVQVFLPSSKVKNRAEDVENQF